MNKPTLTLPGWDGIAAPRLYIKDSNREGLTQLLILCRWDEPSVPEYVDHLCDAARRYLPRARGPPLTRALPLTATIQDYLGMLPELDLKKLAQRDAGLVERLSSMIDVMDPRLKTERMELVHFEYGVFPRKDILAKHELFPNQLPEVVANTSSDPRYKKRGLGLHWMAKAALSLDRTLRPNTSLFARSYRSGPSEVPAPEDLAAAREVLAVIAPALNAGPYLSTLHDCGFLSMPLVLRPVVYQLATGQPAPPEASVYFHRPAAGTTDN